MVWRFWWMQCIYAFNLHFSESLRKYPLQSDFEFKKKPLLLFTALFFAYCCLFCPLPIAFCCLCCPLPIAYCQFWAPGSRSEKCLNIIAPNKDKLIWVQFRCMPPDEQDRVTFIGTLLCILYILCILYFLFCFTFCIFYFVLHILAQATRWVGHSDFDRHFALYIRAFITLVCRQCVHWAICV